MQKVQVTITIYEFDELDPTVQSKVIDQEIRFRLHMESVNQRSEENRKAMLESERMRTPWFFDGMYYERVKDDVYKTLRDQLYEKDGQIFTKDNYEKVVYL